MSLGDYLGGALFFLPTMAAVLGAAWLILRKRFGYLSGLPRGVAFVILATATLLFAEILPAALGVLTRRTTLAAGVLVLGASWALPSRATAAPVTDPEPPRSSPFSLAIAALAVGAVAVYALTRLRSVISLPITDIDMLGFHLPGVAHWIQTGTVWQVDQFLPGFATAQYPNNGDFLILSTVLPWHDLALVRLPAILFLALTGVGVYALALELRAARAAAATFAALVLVLPPLFPFALEGLPDDITLAMLAFGAVFLVRHARSGRTGELALGGLALGIALGTKWFGLTACVVVVVLWVLARLIIRARRRGVVRDGGVLLATMALGGGFWLLRNIIESGNPLYPKAVKLAGVQLFAGSHQDVIDRFGFTIAHYLGQPDILRKYIYPGFKSQLGIAGLALIAGLVVALAWSLRALRSRRRSRSDGHALALLLVALATLGICAVYIITPGTAYGPKNQPIEGFATIRWLMPAIVLGAAVCAAGARALGRWAIVLELAGVAGVLDAIHLDVGVDAGAAVKTAAGLAVIVAGAAILARRRRARPAGRGLPRAGARRAPALALLGACLLALVGVGRLVQTHFDRHSYAPYDPVFAWIDTNAPSGHRIGITGATGSTPGLAFVLPAFGPRLGNPVTYVGDVVVHSVEVPTRESSFRRELQDGRYELLMIGLPFAGRTEEWARSMGLPLLARSRRIALYAVPRNTPA